METRTEISRQSANLFSAEQVAKAISVLTSKPSTSGLMSVQWIVRYSAGVSSQDTNYTEWR
jgi:hypothetical protein